MADRNMSLSMRMYADATNFVHGLVRGERATTHFASTAKREFSSVKQTLGTLQGQLASLGVTIGSLALARQSARMDKNLTQIGQTAGGSKEEVANLRKELFAMGAETGQSIDDLQSGFNNAVQSGLKFKEALPVIGAVNKAVAVTGASANQLTTGLTVATAAYQFDLTNPKTALELLDKMTSAGRLGNAELENLSGIFARVGVAAQSGNMGFEKTLAFIEGLSLIERQPERLGTLAESTLRLFTNANYMRDAAKATGVRFLDKDSMRRDAFEVLGDIKKKYDALTNDRQRIIFLQNAFGKADLDTIKGLKTIFSGNTFEKVNQFTDEIKKAGGTLEKDLPDAIANAVDQTGRLKNELRRAADDFAKPINEAVAGALKWVLGGKDANGNKTGLGLSGEGILAGGAALVGGAVLSKRFGGKLLSRYMGTGAGIAEGKAIQAATGVTPVFVTNWQDGGTSIAGKIAEKGAGGLLDQFGNPIARTTISGTAGTAAKGLPGMATALGPALPLIAVTGLAIALTKQLEGYASGSDEYRERVDAGYNEGFDATLIAEAIRDSSSDQERELKLNQKIEIVDGEVKRVTTSQDASGVSADVYTGAMMGAY